MLSDAKVHCKRDPRPDGHEYEVSKDFQRTTCRDLGAAASSSRFWIGALSWLRRDKLTIGIVSTPRAAGIGGLCGDG